MMTILFASNLLFLSSVTVSLLSCYVESFNSDTTVTTGVTSLYKLCPYTNYCTKNKTKNQDNAEKSACCGNCSCEENCWKRGSCCPDKSNITVIQPLATCESVVVKRSPYVHPTSVEGNLYQRYFVTKSCPTKDDTLAEKCSGNLQSSLEDYVWVTDKTTNDIYNNKHCAICNGVKVFTPWKIRTDCTEALNGKKSPEAAVNFILDECGLTVESPSTEDHTDNVCLVPDISQCNVTGRWESHDLALETACNSFNQIYTKENLIATTRYRNVYCFLCNSPKGQVVSDICSYEYSSIKHGGVSFSGILDYKVFAKRVKETGGNGILEPHPVCAADEIKDPMQVFR